METSNIDNITQLYILFDEMMDNGRFKEIDLILSLFDPNGPLDIALCLLTATKWCEEHLENRDEFYKAVSKRWDVFFHDLRNYGGIKLLQGLK